MFLSVMFSVIGISTFEGRGISVYNTCNIEEWVVMGSHVTRENNMNDYDISRHLLFQFIRRGSKNLWH